LLRARAYNDLSRWGQAVEQARTYVDLLGDDAGAYLEMGIALAELGRPEAAAAAFRKGLGDDPDSVENLKELRPVLPAEGRRNLPSTAPGCPVRRNTRTNWWRMRWRTAT